MFFSRKWFSLQNILYIHLNIPYFPIKGVKVCEKKIQKNYKHSFLNSNTLKSLDTSSLCSSNLLCVSFFHAQAQNSNDDGTLKEENAEEEANDNDDDYEEEEEDISDDIDTLLFTNKLNSSFVGQLWNASANSYYRRKEEVNELSNHIKEKEANDFYTHKISQELYEEEKRETDEIKMFFEKNEEQLLKFKNSALCLLNIAKDLSRKYDHASKDTNELHNEQRIRRKEEEYKKIIDGMNISNKEYSQKKKKGSTTTTSSYDTVEIIKVLDIDSIPCNILNHLFAYKMTRNCSAEICLKVVSRIGMFRDKNSQVSYENMINYLGTLIPNDKNAEIIALFSRCYETVSIPFLVNYIRTYGTFSRSFIVSMYDKYFKKRLFDFVRYEHNGGVRRLPSILTHPYHLSSYVQLLGECSAKKDMYMQLKMKGFVPSNIQTVGTIEKRMKEQEIEDLLNRSSIQNKEKINKIEENKKGKRREIIQRPKMYDVILSSEYSGKPIEYFEEEVPVKFPFEETVTLEDEKLYIENKVKQNIIADGNKYNINEMPETVYKIENNKETNHRENIEASNNTDNTEFILDQECDSYLYKDINRLSPSSLKLQTTLLRPDTTDTKWNNKLVPFENENEKDLSEKEYFYEKLTDVTGGGEEAESSLWELPWKGKRRDSFFFKGRFFKIDREEGWKEIEDVSKQYIRPKRKRTKHCIKRSRIIQRKIKMNEFKKRLLEKVNQE